MPENVRWTQARLFSSLNAQPDQPAEPARLRHSDEWSDNEIAVLHQAHKDGKSHAECLELFPSRTLRAISNKRNRLGLLIKGPYEQGEDSRRLSELVLKGSTVRQIKTELPHLSYDNIYHFVRQR